MAGVGEVVVDAPVRRRRRQAPARRTLYLAGRNIFAERGYHGTTVDVIVESAGLAKGAFYHHWPTKDLLLREIMRNVMKIEVDLAAEAASSWEGTPTEVLTRFIEELFVVVIENRKEAKIFHAEAAMLEQRQFAEVQQMSREFHESIRLIIARGIESGEFVELESVELVSWVIAGALSYAYRWWPLEEPMSAGHVGTLIAKMLMPGLTRTPGSARDRTGTARRELRPAGTNRQR
jgi:AcrR family transcriptional regulator